jgi:hypothetical protein
MKDYGPSPERPYQCFMGRWEGLCKTFDPAGVFLESSAVHMEVYWNGPDSWHLHEHFENLYGVGETIYEIDITVDGKTCRGENEMVKIEGTALTAYNYTFTIQSAATKTTVYNNHYFLDPNTRRIMTHKVRDDKTVVYQIQDFVRVG